MKKYNKGGLIIIFMINILLCCVFLQGAELTTKEQEVENLWGESSLIYWNIIREMTTTLESSLKDKDQKDPSFYFLASPTLDIIDKWFWQDLNNPETPDKKYNENKFLGYLYYLFKNRYKNNTFIEPIDFLFFANNVGNQLPDYSGAQYNRYDNSDAKKSYIEKNKEEKLQYFNSQTSLSDLKFINQFAHTFKDFLAKSNADAMQVLRKDFISIKLRAVSDWFSVPHRSFFVYLFYLYNNHYQQPDQLGYDQPVSEVLDKLFFVEQMQDVLPDYPEEVYRKFEQSMAQKKEAEKKFQEQGSPAVWAAVGAGALAAAAYANKASMQECIGAACLGAATGLAALKLNSDGYLSRFKHWITSWWSTKQPTPKPLDVPSEQSTVTLDESKNSTPRGLHNDIHGNAVPVIILPEE